MYLNWLQKTTVKGNLSLTTSLKGKYVASTGQMPDYKIKLSWYTIAHSRQQRESEN
jgi:hypothetical protein